MNLVQTRESVYDSRFVIEMKKNALLVGRKATLLDAERDLAKVILRNDLDDKRCKRQSRPTQFDKGGDQCRYILHFDGAAEPSNPGPAGGGWWLRCRSTGRIEREGYVPCGNTTNNVAEYGGLLAGLEAVADHGIEGVLVRGDSKLVVYQVRGAWRVKAEHLIPLCKRAQELMLRVKGIIEWVPREQNDYADSLSHKGVAMNIKP